MLSYRSLCDFLEPEAVKSSFFFDNQVATIAIFNRRLLINIRVLYSAMYTLRNSFSSFIKFNFYQQI